MSVNKENPFKKFEVTDEVPNARIKKQVLHAVRFQKTMLDLTELHTRGFVKCVLGLLGNDTNKEV